MSKSLRVKYLLWIDEKAEGPYDKAQIVEMLLSAKMTKQTLCLPDDGKGDWQALGTIPSLLDKGGPPPASPVRPDTNLKISGARRVAILIACLVVGLLVWRYIIYLGASNPASDEHYRRYQKDIDRIHSKADLMKETAEVMALAQEAVKYFPKGTPQERSNLLEIVAESTSMELESDYEKGHRDNARSRAACEEFIRKHRDNP
jgi:hypothetical protein